MVIKREIADTLDILNEKYNNSSTNFEVTCYSKMAVLELCAWVEDMMDRILDRYMRHKIKTQPYRDMFEGKKFKNFGFDYKDDFRRMLCEIIGIHKFEELEQKVFIINNNHVSILVATINTLKLQRNDAAHKYYGVTMVYQSPSVTISQLNQISPILKSFYTQIGKMK